MDDCQYLSKIHFKLEKNIIPPNVKNIYPPHRVYTKFGNTYMSRVSGVRQGKVSLCR